MFSLRCIAKVASDLALCGVGARRFGADGGPGELPPGDRESNAALKPDAPRLILPERRAAARARRAAPLLSLSVRGRYSVRRAKGDGEGESFPQKMEAGRRTSCPSALSKRYSELLQCVNASGLFTPPPNAFFGEPRCSAAVCQEGQWLSGPRAPPDQVRSSGEEKKIKIQNKTCKSNVLFLFCQEF